MGGLGLCGQSRAVRMTLRWGQLCVMPCMWCYCRDRAALIRVACTSTYILYCTVLICRYCMRTHTHSESPRLASSLHPSDQQRAEPAGIAPTRTHVIRCTTAATTSCYCTHNTGQCLGLPWNPFSDALGASVPRPSLAAAEKNQTPTCSASAFRLSPASDAVQKKNSAPLRPPRGQPPPSELCTGHHVCTV